MFILPTFYVMSIRRKPRTFFGYLNYKGKGLFLPPSTTYQYICVCNALQLLQLNTRDYKILGLASAPTVGPRKLIFGNEKHNNYHFEFTL